jgi:acyl dehydratase
MHLKMPTYDSVQIGDAVPPLSLPITRTSIIAAALATRDWQDVHHDDEKAKSGGLKDIIVSIPTTTGYVVRFVTDWAGPRAVVRSSKVRLGGSVYPGDTLTFTGNVVRKEDAGTVIVAIEAKTASTKHASAEVAIVLGQEP